MEVLTLSGYTEEEKVMIAQRYLIPRQMKENSLRPEEVEFTEDAIRAIIRDHTREAGLRNLEREIAGVCRKVATRVAEGKTEKSVVTTENLPDYLGKPEFFSEVAERTETPGVATGLAWTMAGGDILFVEATKMRGRGGLTLTGKLGDVMKESATAALSYVRSRAKALGIDEGVFAKNDIHIHVPEGAIPKDGPSAGVTMVTALVSLLTDRPVCSDVGMTGEITLRGRVLPIGGVKEKVLAAHRAGLKTIILPRRNEKDLADVPKPLQEQLNFVFVDRIEDVLNVALRPVQ
jgi:ATP-dependent Lon protease